MLIDLEEKLSEIDRYEYFKYDFIDINLHLTQIKKLDAKAIVKNNTEKHDLYSKLLKKTR